MVIVADYEIIPDPDKSVFLLGVINRSPAQPVAEY